MGKLLFDDRVIIGRPVHKYNLATPEGRVAMVYDFGRDFERTQKEIKIFTGECEEFNQPYIALKIKEAHERGVKIQVMAGPVLVTANYNAAQSDAYVQHYSQPGNRRISKWKKLGDSFMITQDWLAARFCYDGMLEKRPNNTHLLMLTSVASCYGGELERAVNDAFFVVMVEPKNSDARNNLGYAYLQQGNVKDALFSLEKACALMMDSGEVSRESMENVFNNLGDAYKLAGDYRRAMKNYSHVLWLNPFHEGTLENFSACRNAMKQ